MKTFKLFLTPAATAHIIQIAAWYNEQQKGLGTRFKNSLKTELAAIKKNPFSRSFRYDNVRFAVVKKFPYAVHYTIDEDKDMIVIHAIFGFSQSPGKWKR
ncbi:MAG: type II toxin-antitoxin system RelE/ParE family toxin [Chitinophagaceae bacterium]|nr:type II toxin-antitoxin system RelE/ParE family toxin [Chitinophagaceae bacterium]